MKRCMKAGCEEDALRGQMYCGDHRPARGDKVKKFRAVKAYGTVSKAPGAKKAAAKKSAKKPARKA